MNWLRKPFASIHTGKPAESPILAINSFEEKLYLAPKTKEFHRRNGFKWVNSFATLITSSRAFQIPMVYNMQKSKGQIKRYGLWKLYTWERETGPAGALHKAHRPAPPLIK